MHAVVKCQSLQIHQIKFLEKLEVKWVYSSQAYTQLAGATPAGGGMEMLIMLGIFGLVFYFLIYRPQAKRVKEHKALMSAMAKGDSTNARWFVGKIAKIADDKDFIVISLNDKQKNSTKISCFCSIAKRHYEVAITIKIRTHTC